MNREAEEFRISSDIKQANLELAVSLLRKAVDIKHHHAITDLTYPVRAEIEAFLASQQGEQVNFDIGRMEKAIAVPYHVIPAGLDADGLREWMSSLASQHPEQAEGAQGERERFEVEMLELCLPIERDSHGAYVSDHVRHLWSGWELRAALAQPSPAPESAAVLPPFAEKVLAKLRRFYDCAEDFESGGVDIGRNWLDLLTQLGLLNRVQRSPALWEISQQGEDLLAAPVAQAGQVLIPRGLLEDRPRGVPGFKEWSDRIAELLAAAPAQGGSTDE